jgi:hypothetical protein
VIAVADDVTDETGGGRGVTAVGIVEVATGFGKNDGVHAAAFGFMFRRCLTNNTIIYAYFDMSKCRFFSQNAHIIDCLPYFFSLSLSLKR